VSRILILDDEEAILRSLRRLLRAVPCSYGGKTFPLETELFSDPIEALERVRQRQFDLPLTDYRMPRMDGVEFLRRTREIQPDCARLILSGYADLNAVLIGNASPATAQYLGSYWPPAELPCAAQPGGQFVVPGFENAVIGLPAAERYSFNFAFAAQTLDHALLNGAALARFERAMFGRGNADAPGNDEFDATTARRASDHDALVIYLNVSSTRPSVSGFGIFRDGLEAP